MSIFDVFKTKWSSKSMSEQDRRKIFWYLKRASSYTAWRRQADAFDRFASVVERQVIDEPIAPPGCSDPSWATNWEESYVGVLKGQVLYEQGLARLQRGDRTVWRFNDSGILADALRIHQHWWTALVNHGPHGDVYLDGKYVDEMVTAINDGALHATAGIVQAELAEPLAHYFWSPDFIAEIDREVGSAIHWNDVPTIAKQVIVRSGEVVPCSGIFEPQIQDGCMNYLVEGAPAPKAVSVDEVDGDFVVRSAVWRLLWEDTRYLDGTVPDEEKLYFVYREEPKTGALTNVAFERPISRHSNDKATRTGVWVLTDRLDVRQRFEVGDTLPRYDGRDVVWLWVGKE